jgi:hypothetical protein
MVCNKVPYQEMGASYNIKSGGSEASHWNEDLLRPPKNPLPLLLRTASKRCSMFLRHNLNLIIFTLKIFNGSLFLKKIKSHNTSRVKSPKCAE